MIEAGFLLAASILLAWRMGKTLPEADWSLFNLFAFLGAAPYRDHQQVKPPGINILYWLLVRIVGKDIHRVRTAYHLLINLGCFIALYSWGFPAALVWLVLMNCAHYFCFSGNVEAPCAVLLTIVLASPNPWVKVIAFSLAMFFSLKVWPMGIILWPLISETITILTLWLLLFAVFAIRDFAYVKQMLFCIIIGSSRAAKRRMPIWEWMKRQYINNNCWYQAFGVTILFMGFSIWNRPEFLFWLPCLLYLGFCLTGNLFGVYHQLPFIPWIAMAFPNSLPLAFLLSLGLLGIQGFFLPNIYLVGYLSQKDLSYWTKETGLYMKGKDFWANTWAHGLYIYADVFPKYGIEYQVGCRVFDEWEQERNRKLREDPPKYAIIGCGGDGRVKFKTDRGARMGVFTILQLRGRTDL